MINKNNPGLENVQEWWVNPKYKFEAVPGSGGEDINVNIIAQ